MLVLRKRKTINEKQIHKITTINLDKVVSIDIYNKDKKYRTRFFMGKREKGINVEISFGIKEVNSISENNTVTLIFNMLNADRFKQTALVVKKDNQLITTEPNDDIEKLEEKRKHIKVKSKLSGEICVMDKKLYIEIANISVGGVFIKTNYDLLINGVYTIHIRELNICVKVMLLRQQKNKYDEIEGYGCKFEEISDQNAEKISCYINSILVKQRETLISRDVYNYF